MRHNLRTGQHLLIGRSVVFGVCPEDALNFTTLTRQAFTCTRSRSSSRTRRPTWSGSRCTRANEGAKTIKGLNHDAGTLLLDDVQDEVVTASIVKLTEVIVYRPDGHKDEPANMGYQEKIGGQRVDIEETKGRSIAKPWPLNLNGTKKATCDAEPEYLEFLPYEKTGWAGVVLS